MNYLDKIVRFNTLIISIVSIVVLIIIVPFNLIGDTEQIPIHSVNKSPLFTIRKPQISFNFPRNILKKKNSPSEITSRIAGAYTSYNEDNNLKPSPKIPSSTPTNAPSPTPTLIPIGKPLSIEIAKIGISANVIPVGITENHAMDIPQDFFTSGWYEHSVKPGEEGSAIINGHFDTSSGSPAIFYKLGDLIEGDTIIITTDLQQKLTFIVDTSFTHPLQDFPTDIVYGSSKGKILKLLTCDGIWDPIKSLYSDRRVLIAHLDEKNILEVTSQ